MKCDFQGTSISLLRKHMNLKHSKDWSKETVIKCIMCAKEFAEKWDLMTHRKSIHLNAVAICKNFANGACSYTAEYCWWNHGERKTNIGDIQCFICSQTFNNKTEMMIHRKKNHVSIVQTCSKFKEGICKFQDEFCWFMHTAAEEVNSHDNSEEVIDDQDDEKNKEMNSDFQEVLTNPKPPLGAKNRYQNQN